MTPKTVVVPRLWVRGITLYPFVLLRKGEEGDEALVAHEHWHWHEIDSLPWWKRPIWYVAYILLAVCFSHDQHPMERQNET